MKKTACKKSISRISSKGPLLSVSPIVLWMSAFFILPVLLVVAVSFFTRGQYGGIEYSFTFDNYIKLLNPLYTKILWNSFAISAATTLLCLILGYPFAY